MCISDLILLCIYLFKVILIDYYKHYNKLEFDDPEIHDAELKV